MSTTQHVISLLTDILGLENRPPLQSSSRLMGSIAELDSMAVINVITALEDTFGITVHDDEISAATFESVGSLVAYVDQKLAA